MFKAVVRRVDAGVHQMVLTGLTPGTPYVVRVIPLYGELVGLTGMDEERTGLLSAMLQKRLPKNLNLLFRNLPKKSFCQVDTNV